MENIIERVKNGKFTLVAEIGVNYYDIAKEQNITPMEAAKLMVKEAKEAGVHAVKFQTYKAETLAAKNSPYYWDIKEEPTKSQYELFKKFDLFGYNEYKEISEYCKSLGIEFLSTAFDTESADYLDELMSVYKISSSDLNNLPFIEFQAKKNKPILLSVGASNEEEITKAIETIRKVNDKPIVLLHCVLEYPTPYEHANLNKIVSLKEKYENSYDNIYIGYSDHTKPDACYDIIKTAYNLGAVLVEKHYTLDKTLKGNDHYHAMDPVDAKNIIEGIEFVDKIRGEYAIKCLESESKARSNARRSIVSLGKINKGEVITTEMLTYKRPGTGISPTEINNIIGKKAKIDIDDDTILSYDMFE